LLPGHRRTARDLRKLFSRRFFSQKKDDRAEAGGFRSVNNEVAMKRRLIAISTACLLVTGAGAAALHYSGAVSALGRAASSLSTNARLEPSASNETVASFSRAGWEPGVAYAQTIDLSIGVGTRDKDTVNQLFRLRLGGKLETLVSEVLGKEVRVRLRLVDAKLETGDKSIPAEVVRAFATPFFADYDERGRALRLHVPPDLDRTVRGILREIVSTTQLTTPEPAAARWSAVEADTTGDYKASYKTLSSTKIVRQKSGYVPAASQAGDKASQPKPDIVAYGAEFQIDDWGRVKELKCTSHLNAAAGETETFFEARAELTLKTVSRSRETQGLPVSIAGLVAISITSDRGDAEGTKNLDRQLVAGADVKGILDGITKEKDGQTARPRTRLEALFRLDPSAIKTALALLDEANAPTVLAALGGAGTAEAQNALRDVLRDERRSPAERLAAVDGAFGLENPTAETATTLEALTRSENPELKQNATLALGVTSARMAENDPTAAQGILQRLASDYTSAKSSDDRIRIVGGLGNTRSADSLATLTQAMASSDPAVRAAAAAALRFVPDPAADVLIAKAMTSDPDTNVRNAALLAAGYRAYDPLAQALATVSKDADANIRGMLVTTLAQMAQEDGEALVLLDWIANNDPSTEIRSRAQGALGRAS
jgi:HEAT repeat protein